MSSSELFTRALFLSSMSCCNGDERLELQDQQQQSEEHGAQGGSGEYQEPMTGGGSNYEYSYGEGYSVNDAAAAADGRESANCRDTALHYVQVNSFDCFESEGPTTAIAASSMQHQHSECIEVESAPGVLDHWRPTEDQPLNLTSMKSPFVPARSINPCVATAAAFFVELDEPVVATAAEVHPDAYVAIDDRHPYREQYRTMRPLLPSAVDSIQKKEQSQPLNEYVLKRERNNMAVRKSREKAKRRFNELQDRERRLERANSKLESKIDVLSKEVKALRNMYHSMQESGLLP